MSEAQFDGKEQIFLATTALEEFWETKKTIVFLGEWCLLYGRRPFWERLNGKLLGSPFSNAKGAHDAHKYVNEIYERVLPRVGDILNSIHGTHNSLRYWRIVAGPWLMTYLHVVYDRYSHIKKALEQYPDFDTLVMAESSFVVPADLMGYVNSLKEDAENLQIYSKILVALGKTYPCKELAKTADPRRVEPVRDTLKRRMFGAVATLIPFIGITSTRSIFLKNTYFPLSFILPLVLKHPRLLSISIVGTPKPSNYVYNQEARKEIKKIWVGDGEFEQCVSAMLFSDIPKCYVEGYRDIKARTCGCYPENPKAIFSATAWYYDEGFKQWAAAAADRGALLIGTTHGGAYGGWADFSSELHETEIVNRYYTWGWVRLDSRADVIPYPASKLVGRKKLVADNSKSGILWAGTTSPRYLRDFPKLPLFYSEYLSWQCRFASTLRKNLVDNVRFRPHREDGGWGVVGRLRSCIPGVQIETWEVSFEESLANCRLYVCDHMSTTFAEALAVNKPTILFWNPQANELKPEAQFYYDLLRDNGILFDNPEGAGAAVNQFYDDVESWWNEPERQNAIQVFCERFARTSPDAVSLWVDEFKRVSNRPYLH